MPIAPVRFDQGVPVYRFHKELIHCGRFTTADGAPFEVDRDLIRHWAMTFRSMRAHQVCVPVPIDHKRLDAEGNRGFVVDMFPMGQKLVGVVELTGADAPRLAASNDVSIHAEPEFVDSLGNRYLYPIRHVALTPDPRITGMERFQAISASSGGPARQVPVARLCPDTPQSKTRSGDVRSNLPRGRDSVASRTGSHKPLQGASMPDSPSDDSLSPTSEPSGAPPADFRKAIRDLIDDDQLDRIEQVRQLHEILVAQERALGVFDPPLPEPHDGECECEDDDFPEDDSQNDGSSDENDEEVSDEENEDSIGKHGRRRRSLSNVDRSIVRLAAENRRMKLDKLVASGKITPAVRSRLEAHFVGPNDRAVALSLANGTVGQFDALVDALEHNVSVSLGEKSGRQVVLANPYQGDCDALPRGLENDMRKAAGLKPV